MPGRAKLAGVAKKDNLNRDTVDALMEARGVDGVAHLRRRIAHVAGEEAAPERSYLSRVLRGERPASPSLIILIAQALKVPAVAIMGDELDPDAEEVIQAAAS